MRNRIGLGRLLMLALMGGLWVALSVHVEGCSAIGFALGASADAQNGTGGAGLLLTVKVGRPVTLQLWDGRTLEGRFAGWSRDSGAAIAVTDIASPRGMTVRLATRRGDIAIPAENIARVSITVNGGKLGGLLVGLAADVMVISSMRSSHAHSNDCGGTLVDNR